jgi:glycosyltransferase involved in cell wall biosynthesis
MPLLMSAADCLLLTSSIEGSPNVVKEAIQCNLPVVTTRVGDVEEVLAGVEPSWFCDANPDAVGAALAECLREPRRSNGREASGWLGSEPIARLHLDLYEELAPGSL